MKVQVITSVEFSNRKSTWFANAVIHRDMRDDLLIAESEVCFGDLADLSTPIVAEIDGAKYVIRLAPNGEALAVQFVEWEADFQMITDRKSALDAAAPDRGVSKYGIEYHYSAVRDAAASLGFVRIVHIMHADGSKWVGGY